MGVPASALRSAASAVKGGATATSTPRTRRERGRERARERERLRHGLVHLPVRGDERGSHARPPQRFHAGQRRALEELERGAAAGREVADARRRLPRPAPPRASRRRPPRCRPSSAPASPRPRACRRRRAASRTGRAGRSRTRSSPAPRAPRSRRASAGRCRAPSRRRESARRCARRPCRRGSPPRRGPRAAAARSSRRAGASRCRPGRVSTSDLPTGSPLREQERVRHGAADRDGVRARRERLEHRELVRDLGAAEDAQVGVLGLRRARARAPRPRAAAGSRRRPRGTRCASPSVLACARCAVPNASFTYTSQSRASCATNAGSFASSPAWKRRFSSRSASPSRSARDRGLDRRADAVGRERQPHVLARRARASTSGRARPSGRPRCEASDARPPARRTKSSVSCEARMRESSATAPSFSGTFRSARMNTRLPASARSATERQRRCRRRSQLLGDDARELRHAARVAPLVVVPGDQLEEVLVQLDARCRRRRSTSAGRG